MFNRKLASGFEREATMRGGDIFFFIYLARAWENENNMLSTGRAPRNGTAGMKHGGEGKKGLKNQGRKKVKESGAFCRHRKDEK